MTPSLRQLEREVWELHNRWAGQDTGWREFYEAALLAYKAELDRLLAETVPADPVRARARWLALRRARLLAPSEPAAPPRRASLTGGSDLAGNLVTLCFAHHEAHHEGLLDVRGDAEHGFRFRHRATPAALGSRTRGRGGRLRPDRARLGRPELRARGQ